MTINYKKGFTLIELLVVIAIIGILSSIVLASLNTAREKSRDARRQTDLQQIALALELFYDTCRIYPTETTNGTPITPAEALTNSVCPTNPATSADYTLGDFMSQVPTDPQASQNYQYEYDETEGTYCLGAQMEGTTIPDNNNADCVTLLGGSINFAIAP